MVTTHIYKTVLFDLDGTLTNPKTGITKSVQHALRQFDIQEDHLDHLIGYIGPPLRTAFRELHHLSENQSEQAIAYYRDYFAETGIYENEVYAGIPELLTSLNKQNKQLFVATSKPTVYAKKIITHFNLDSFFTAVEGSELDGTRSDKGELIESVMERFHLQSESTVMIGDRKHDIIGANKNGIDSIGVGYGYGSMEELLSAGATHLFQTIPEIQAFLLSH